MRTPSRMSDPEFNSQFKRPWRMLPKSPAWRFEIARGPLRQRCQAAVYDGQQATAGPLPRIYGVAG
jgi:hypothetical protein